MENRAKVLKEVKWLIFHEDIVVLNQICAEVIKYLYPYAKSFFGVTKKL